MNPLATTLWEIGQIEKLKSCAHFASSALHRSERNRSQSNPPFNTTRLKTRDLLMDDCLLPAVVTLLTPARSPNQASKSGDDVPGVPKRPSAHRWGRVSVIWRSEAPTGAGS